MWWIIAIVIVVLVILVAKWANYASSSKHYMSRAQNRLSMTENLWLSIDRKFTAGKLNGDELDRAEQRLARFRDDQLVDGTRDPEMEEHARNYAALMEFTRRKVEDIRLTNGANWEQIDKETDEYGEQVLQKAREGRKSLEKMYEGLGLQPPQSHIN